MSVLLLVLSASIACAQDENPWNYDLSASLWTGNTAVEVLPTGGGDPIKVELPDFLDNFQLGFVLRGEARRGKFGMLLDVGYIELTASDSPSNPDIDDIDVDVNSTLINLSGIFRLHGADKFSLDVLPGIQYYNGDSDVTIQGTNPSMTSGNRSFWDPVLGLRVRTKLLNKIGINAYGNVGGFGLSSQTTAQVAAVIGYDLFEFLQVQAGVRIVSWEFDESEDQDLLSQRISGLTFGLMLSL